jgi:hypothetical protein
MRARCKRADKTCVCAFYRATVIGAAVGGLVLVIIAGVRARAR